MEQVEHKFRAYSWNVVHRYEVEFVVVACEVNPGGAIRRASFSSRNRFDRQDLEPPMIDGDVLHEEATFRVRVPFHFSPRYEGRDHELVQEASRAWRNGEAA